MSNMSVNDSTNEFADRVTLLCFEKFNNLPSKGKPILGKEWTTLSGIVQSDDENRLTVVSLATGTKCIGKSKLSSQGTVVNDSHAEVLARRGLVHYILGQIKLARNNDVDTIFDVSSPNCRLTLKPGIKFHFFSSQMPCGDASIFPKNEESRKRSADTDIGSKIKKQKVDDIHRTGAKCLLEETKQDLNLPGPAYHTVGAVRTKPGRGDPTLSVSCSDKILRWNHIGIQGAVLSLLIDPVYLSTIVISGQCPYSHAALHRAVVSRLDTPGKIYPNLLRSSLNFQGSKYSNPSSKPCPSSVLWRIGDRFHNNGYHEVLVDGRKQGVTKKTMDKPSSMSMVCKKSLFDIFKSFNEIYSTMTYQAVKSEATTYRQDWNEKTRQLGCWTEKPITLIEFT